MQKNEPINIVSLLIRVCDALKAYASSKNIELILVTVEQEIRIAFVYDLYHRYYRLLCTIINHLPGFNKLHVKVGITVKDNTSFVSINIYNTGADLRNLSVINTNNIAITVEAYSETGTSFLITYPVLNVVAVMSDPAKTNAPSTNYTKVVTDIRTHFLKLHLNNPAARLTETRPKEAAFLATVNACIIKNMAYEQFDTNALSDTLAMSRAQLFRRLKSLISTSPGSYIKKLRLEKAKELLETLDVTISEVAYRTGFNSPSNFAKVFSEAFGLTPSQFQRQKPGATNR